MASSNLEAVRRGFDAAKRGDVDTMASLLHPEVYWGAPGPTVDGCHNREQALRWMHGAMAQGIMVEIVDARELPDGRVVLALQRTSPHEGETELPPPHGQLLTFRSGKVAEMLVYPTPEDALQAAGLTDAAL